MMHHLVRSVGSKKQFHPLSNVRKFSSATDPSDPRSWRKPIAERQGEWHSKFNWFASDRKANSPDTITFLQTDINLRPSAIRKWYKNFSKAAAIYDQRYIARRHEVLGSELAAAHFLVHRGASVKFHGISEWVKRVGDKYRLPHIYDPNYVLEAIDASGMVLYYQGLCNMTNLKKLRWLSLNNSPEVNNWFIDKISSEYRYSLEYLDISNCTQVTERGLVALYRMKKLKMLKVHNLAESEVFQLTCLMLEDLHPALKTEGVKYLTVNEEVPQVASELSNK